MCSQKKIIFIGGTSYSGTTFLDMILSNHKTGFSCGEAIALFFPTLKHHINPLCGCGSESCKVWQNFKSKGAKNLYSSIFAQFQNINYIVDSGKNPFWIKKQAEYAKKNGFKVYHVLIWKHPSDLALSFYKRKRGNEWVKKWINYHKRYFSFVKDANVINYNELVNSEKTLEELCLKLNIPYNHDQKNYWKKEHHTLFGNKSAKVHLYKDHKNKSSIIENIDRVHNIENENLLTNLGTIYNTSDENKSIQNIVNEIITNNPIIKNIEQDLKSNNLQNLTKNRMNAISRSLYTLAISFYRLYKKFTL